MHPALTSSLLVGVGGFAGSLARYGLAVGAARFSWTWPLGTLAANALGCFAIGLIAGLASATASVTPNMRLLLATGFCGGFTTMSSFVYETAQFLKTGELLHGALYFAATLAGSFAAFYLGLLAVRLLARGGGGLWN